MTRLNDFLTHRSSNREEFMRLVVFLFATTMCLLLTPLHFIGVIGIQDMPMLISSAAMMAVSAVALVAWGFRWARLTTVFAADAILCQAILCVRIYIICAGDYVQGQPMLVVNETISYMIVLFLVFSLMTRAAFVVTGLNIAALIVTFLFTRSELVFGMLLLFGAMQVMTSCFSILQRRLLDRTYAELKTFAGNEAEMLALFNVDHADLTALLRIAASRRAKSHIQDLQVDALSVRAQENLLAIADSIKAVQIKRRRDIATVFPDLSETELTVCRLVAAGKTINEIAADTGKQPNNIATVRGNIRRKLGLTSRQDLRQYLLQKIDL